MQNAVFNGMNAARGFGQPEQLFGDGGVLSAVTTTLLFAVGLLCVLMIIVGGFRYVISGGNATAVTAAKNTILYAVVGLVIALLAYSIVGFVLGALTPGVGAGFTNV